MKSKGWSNFKWGVKEFLKLYSDEDSFFSKKRIESGVAFLVGEFGMIFFLLKNIESMTASDMAIWASIQFVIAGYTVNQIQKEKNKKD